MMIEDLGRNASTGKQADVILLDFSKAFDKVNHSKILRKLHQYGIRGKVLSWIQTFLGNRSQWVVIDGEESDSIPVNSGIPQGSVLGPILFLAYMNDLPDEISSQVRLFADDTTLYLTRQLGTSKGPRHVIGVGVEMGYAIQPFKVPGGTGDSI